MDLLSIIASLLGGVIASSSIIFSNFAKGKELIAKLTPYQALIGAVLAILGVFSLLSFGGNVLSLIFAGCQIIVGCLLGAPLIAKWISKVNDKADDKFLEIIKKFAPYQSIFGLVLLVFIILQLLRTGV